MYCNNIVCTRTFRQWKVARHSYNTRVKGLKIQYGALHFNQYNNLNDSLITSYTTIFLKSSVSCMQQFFISPPQKKFEKLKDKLMSAKSFMSVEKTRTSLFLETSCGSQERIQFRRCHQDGTRLTMVTRLMTTNV